MCEEFSNTAKVQLNESSNVSKQHILFFKDFSLMSENLYGSFRNDTKLRLLPHENTIFTFRRKCNNTIDEIFKVTSGVHNISCTLEEGLNIMLDIHLQHGGTIPSTIEGKISIDGSTNTHVCLCFTPLNLFFLFSIKRWYPLFKYV
jgi:hypothetical protein